MVTPCRSNSSWFQPHTMLSPARPCVMWSMVAMRLGGERRRHQRHVDGREYADLLGQRADGGAVRHGLERLAVDVGLALVAAPLRDRQDELHAGAIGDLAHGGDVVPVAGQRSGARLIVRPPSQLALNTPSLKRLGPRIGLVVGVCVMACSSQPPSRSSAGASLRCLPVARWLRYPYHAGRSHADRAGRLRAGCVGRRRAARGSRARAGSAACRSQSRRHR